MRKKRQTVFLNDVLVEDFAAEGKALARVNGKVIFIENTIPGDVVDIQLGKTKKDWAIGWPITFKKYSADRVVPFCSHFGLCGGCVWQMMPYHLQLKNKQQQVFDNLTRIGRIPIPEITPIIGAVELTQYRNKLEFTFANKKFVPKEAFVEIKTEEANLPNGYGGFHAKGVFDKVVEIDTCHLQAEPTNAIRKAIVQYGIDNNLTFYDAKAHTGWLRNLMVRLATTGELMLNIIVGYADELHQQALTNTLLAQFPAITTLLFTINEKWNDSIYDLEPIPYFGKGFIVEKLEDFAFKISPKSFFQTNTKQAEKLYNVVRNLAQLDGSQTVYDLYCGTGSIGIFLSKQAKKIVGVETVQDAITDANENAAMNNINHTHFFAGDVIDICNDAFFNTNGTPDIIITDPPRIGMHEKLVRKLLDIAATVIIYVSCNPATQARDLAILDEKYQVTNIQPVDMFPHTHHIENVVKLILK